MNPITGRRFAKTWLAEKLFPFAKSFYKEKELLLKLIGLFHLGLKINRKSITLANQLPNKTWKDLMNGLIPKLQPSTKN